MELPALLPEELHYTKVAENSRNLLNMLVKIPQDLIVFFEYACGDETWSGNHPDFMREVIQWMTQQFYQDNFHVEFAQRATSSIREHYHILHPFITTNLSIRYNGSQAEVSSLLWGATSEFLRTTIRQECRDKNTQELEFEDMTPAVFSQVDEFIKTGSVKELWRKEQHEVLEVLRCASEWEIVGLKHLCEDILKRYINRNNVIDMLIMAFEEHWGLLKEACEDFINSLEVGVRFPRSDLAHFSMELVDFREDALEIFENLHHYITHLICGHDLTEQPAFSDVINRCPNMICLDISHSISFSDRLLDIPDTLEELDLSKCPWLSNKNIRKIVEICPNLTKITLASNSQINYTGWGILRNFQHLEKLDITRCQQVNDEDFKIILQACGNVTHFCLEGCSGLTDNAFFELGQNVPMLSDLDVSRCNISDGGLIDLTMRCKHLITLSAVRCPNLTEKGIIEAVRNAPNLRSINISKCNLSQFAVDEINGLRPFLEVTF